MIVGLFYGLNGKAGKMLLSWILSVFTLGIYGIYIIYRSYKDQKSSMMLWNMLYSKEKRTGKTTIKPNRLK